jgi:hypothetical protein
MNDPQHPEDPSRDPMIGRTGLSSAAIGWIAGAIFIVVVTALIFGLGRNGLRPMSSESPSPTTGTVPSTSPGTR